MRAQIRRWSLLLASLITLAGCVSSPTVGLDTTEADGIALATDHDSGNSSTEPEPEPSAQDYPVRAFPVQTLYELLVAEFAGMRGDIQLAVDKYVEQAQITRDPNVVERATRTASFTDDRAALEQLSRLWLEVDPDNIDARKLAFYFLARSDVVNAGFEQGEYLLAHGNAEALLSLTGFTAGLDTNERTILIEKYTALINQYPANSNLLLSKMRLEGQQNQLEQALKTGTQLLKIDPDNEDARLAVTQLLYQQGDIARATTTLEAGIGRNPMSKKLHLQLIRFTAVSDLSAAQKKATILAARFEDDVDLQFTLGLLNKQLGLRDQARQAFNNMLSLNRRAADAHYHLAVMAEEDNEVGEALSHYALVTTGENLLPATARLTRLMSENGQLTEARLYLHRLRMELPDMMVTFYRMESELLMGHENYLNAHALLTEGLENHPDSFDLLYTRSMVSEKLNDVASMEQDLRAILDQDTGNASALNALGYSLANHTERYDEALLLIEQALSISPNDPAIIDSLGWVLYRLGNNEEALNHLREAMATMPDPEVAAHLGEVLWVSGEKNEAQSVWRQALERDPNNKYLLDTLGRFNVEL